MSFIYSIFLIASGFLTLVVLGYGTAHALMPEPYKRYVPLIAPVTGFALLCLVTIALTGNFDLPTSTSCLAAAAALTAITVLAAVRNPGDFARLRGSWRILFGLTAFIAAFVFWPLLHQGVDLYLGTSNPDFYQSLSLLDALRRDKLAFFVSPSDLGNFGLEPFTSVFPMYYQARFGGVTFALLLQFVTGADAKAALMATIVVCVLSLAPVVYFFASAMLRLNDRAALISGLLVAIAAPTSMSVLHVFLGQNTSLAILPFCLTLVYIALKELDNKLIVFAALVINAMVFIYVLMLPYILAPLGFYTLYRFAHDGTKYIRRFVAAAVFLVIAVVVVHAGMLEQSLQFWADLFLLLGRMAQSHYYADFLTEDFVVYLTGISSYPMSGNLLVWQFGNWVRIPLLALGFAVLGLYAWLLNAWRKSAERDAAVAMHALLGVYFAVWIYYTFFNVYGYASFKMSSWLQFVLVPMLAFGIDRWLLARGEAQSVFRKGSTRYRVTGALLVVYVASNLASSLDYEWKSYGKDRKRGQIINSFGVGGNPQVREILPALEKYTRPQSMVSAAFPDSIANGWAAYYAYLAGRSAAMTSHWLSADDESYLPDIVTGQVRDSFGRLGPDKRPFFRDGKADYYLLPGRSNLNEEIVDPVQGDALWDNGFARLVDASAAKDLVITGRGLYRLEYFAKDRLAWWFPERMRWSGEGAEFLHLNPSRPGEPYHLSFVAISGYGISQDTRTVEVFHNGKKIDERRIEAASRIVSARYYPVPGVNHLVVRIREKTSALKRMFGLWNRGIHVDWRLLNVAFAQVRVRPEAAGPPAPGPARMTFKALFDNAVAFNGINIDGWLRNRAEFSLAPPPGSTALRLTYLVPGLPEYRFPYPLKFKVNGREITRSVEKPGIDSVDLAFEPSAAGEPVSVSIEAAQFKLTPGDDTRGGADFVQSIHLEEVAFTSPGRPS